MARPCAGTRPLCIQQQLACSSAVTGDPGTRHAEMLRKHSDMCYSWQLLPPDESPWSYHRSLVSSGARVIGYPRSIAMKITPCRLVHHSSKCVCRLTQDSSESVPSLEAARLAVLGPSYSGSAQRPGSATSGKACTTTKQATHT